MVYQSVSKDLGTTLPLWIGGVDGFPPPFVGAIAVPETVPLKSGDSVAAYVDENWILAEVVAVSPTGRYDVKDVDDEQKVRLTMARRRLIPLPKWRADPERDAHALFPLEAIVLALYPQTTCFYKGEQGASIHEGHDEMARCRSRPTSATACYRRLLGDV
ncbi:hypothetical protein Y032_0345g3095 [Ancylostoma ceylanicum]|uniref:SGF29 C-terminal domain-containing protein n=1 Tax=Ancylostoma ceylanicum TaxID=53326 RepID=A0A016RY16_9BILA|nr:hypothetical protein Y032_0345g3095 [Ancylostoma ceylanicum]